MRFTLAAAAIFLGFASAQAILAEPAQLTSVNPLSMPAPALGVTPELPKDDRRPEAKIVPGLWARLVRSAEHDEIAVIVELHSPRRLTSKTEYSRDWDAEQAQLSAFVEHLFAEKADGLIFNLRGLSYFPIVFGTIRRSDVQSLAALPEVRRIYEDEVVRAFRSEGGGLMGANVLRTTFGGSGNGVGVAVLDTGIEDTHPEFVGRVVAHGDFTATTGVGTKDDHGHGTAAAGIIAGASGGMAPQASLWAIKVLKADGNATASSVLNGLDAVYAARHDFGGLDIINMSLGGSLPYNSDCDAVSPYNALLNSLHGAGIAIFAASGNDGFINGVSDPACHSKAISVGAVYDANVGPRGPFKNDCIDVSTAVDQITCYSNSGNPLDILAPADCARTPAPGGGYDNCFNGTSAASPYAAGVAAQLLSLKPGTTPTVLRTALMTTGRPLTDVNSITRNRVDAVAAFQALGGGGNTQPCIRDADTACVQGGRFEINVTWANNQGSGTAQVMTFGGQRTENNEAVFYYFQAATNFEMGVKMLNACVPFFGNKFWVFISGLTDQGRTVTIRDTQTGAVKTYSNPAGKLSTTFADTAAFNCS